MSNVKYVKFLDEINTLVNKYKKNNILVIGDFILDIYTYCNALGKTSKTPTLSVKKNYSENFLGGSGLFANLIANSGSKITLLTSLGFDDNFDKAIKLSKNVFKIKYFREKNRPTTSKERFWVDNYKLLQVDILNNKNLLKFTEDKIIKYLDENLTKFSAVILSDSKHGFFSANLYKRILKSIKKNNVLLAIDSQLNSSHSKYINYQNSDIFALNESEARLFLNDYSSSLSKLGRKIFTKQKLKKYFILKLGANGIRVFDKKNDLFFPSIKVNAIDPIGSGDAFLSFFILSILSSNFNLKLSCFMATSAAAYSTTYMGTKPIVMDDFINFLKKII